MTNLIVELSKYALILLMALYTCMTFVSFKMKTRKSSDFMLAEMTFIMLLLQFVAYLVLYLKLGENEDLIYYYGFQALFMVLITSLWRLFYKDIHSTVLSNMCMMITIGFIMLTRIDTKQSVKQFKIVIIAMIVSMLVPVIVRKWKSICLKKKNTDANASVFFRIIQLFYYRLGYWCRTGSAPRYPPLSIRAWSRGRRPWLCTGCRRHPPDRYRYLRQ